MIKYPAQLDDNSSLALVTDNSSPIQADVVNRLRNAVIAVEAELGVKPSGIYSTVRARLDALDGLVNSFQFIRLAQDLGGSITLPKVIGIQGRPVSNTVPNYLDVIMWNGISWAPRNIGVDGYIIISGDLSGDTHSQTVIGLHGRPLSATAPLLNQVIGWDGYVWKPMTGGGGGGPGLSPIPVTSPLVTTSYTITPVTEYFIGIGTLTGIITISLPAAPALGDTYEIKDVLGSAAAFNVTIDSVDAKNIDGALTYILNINYQAAKFTYTGTQWSVI